MNPIFTNTNQNIWYTINISIVRFDHRNQFQWFRHIISTSYVCTVDTKAMMYLEHCCPGSKGWRGPKRIGAAIVGTSLRYADCNNNYALSKVYCI